MRHPDHRPIYSVERDPEGNFWTVTCSCGVFEESGSSRQVVRDEFYWHIKRKLENEKPTMWDDGEL